MYRDRYTKRQLERMDIARELLANRYMLNVILSTLYKLAISIDDFLEVAKQKEKGLIGKRTKKEERTKEEIKKEWENRYDKLAYFIEHDELEKVKTDLTALNSFIETKEYAEAISELDKCVFVLKHIEDKYAFNLQNVF